MNNNRKKMKMTRVLRPQRHLKKGKMKKKRKYHQEKKRRKRKRSHLIQRMKKNTRSTYLSLQESTLERHKRPTWFMG